LRELKAIRAGSLTILFDVEIHPTRGQPAALRTTVLT
jgi:hypothetical protein